VVASVEAVEAQEATKPAPVPTPQTNGHHSPASSRASTPGKREAESDDYSDSKDSSPPPKKKLKAEVDEDAAFAARLQAEEDKMARPTRGGASRKAAPAKKKRKTPKKTRVTASDDSDLDGMDKKDKPKKKTGFHVGQDLGSWILTDILRNL
jgi:upstream activation factor subunit UAF30